MDALDRKSGSVERSSTAQPTDWERLGRVLLAEALQYRGDVLRERWTEIARKASSGEPVTREDWRRLSEDMVQFTHVVEEIEEATRR
jgi:N-dimethylarginine dimethylaminohydrolase